MLFDSDSVETVTVDSYGTLVDPSSICHTLSDHVDDPIQIANLWFSRSLLNKLVANFIDVYEPFDVLSRDGLNYALEYHGIELDEQARNEILSAYNNLDVYNGVADGITKIADKGYDVYVISNGTKDMLDKLVRHTGIEDVIDDTVSADEVEIYKPDAEIYRHAADRTSTSIDDILHISGPFFDVLGAMSAGMQGGWINYENGPHDSFAGEPDLEITSFNELADLLPGRDK